MMFVAELEELVELNEYMNEGVISYSMPTLPVVFAVILLHMA